MALQREMSVPVWGTAAAERAVEVTFAGQRKATQAGAAGRWRVSLAPLRADDRPHDLAVTAGETAVVRDVLVGDVWVAAGQSNMEFARFR